MSSSVEFNVNTTGGPDATGNRDVEKSEKKAPARPQYNERVISETNLATRLGARPPCFRSLGHEVLCVAILTMACALAQISSGQVQVASPTIGKYFDVSGGVLSWAVSAFTLSAGALLLFMGGIADAIGRRPVIIVSFALYAVLCLAAGFAKDYITFVILRALQGIASAAVVPASAGEIGSIYEYPSPRKNRALACFAGGAPVGAIVGTLLGGVCIQILNWQAIFFFNAIFYGLIAVASYFVVPETTKVTKQHVIRGLKRLDYGGAFLCTSGLTLLTFALSQAEAAPQGWATPYIISCVVIGFFVIVAFVIYESYVPEIPIMPMQLWKYLQFGICMLVGTCGWMSYTLILYYFTYYWQEVRHKSPLIAGVMALPGCFFGILVNLFAAMFLHKISGKILLFIGMTGHFLSALLWCFITPTSIYWAIPFLSMFFGPLGSDLIYNVCNMQALLSVSKDLQSSAAGTFNTVMQVSMTFSLAISATIVGIISTREGTSPQGLVNSYKGGYYFALGCCSLGIILCFFLKVGTAGNHEPGEVDENEESISPSPNQNSERNVIGITTQCLGSTPGETPPVLSPGFVTPERASSPKREVENQLSTISERNEDAYHTGRAQSDSDCYGLVRQISR